MDARIVPKTGRRAETADPPAIQSPVARVVLGLLFVLVLCLGAWAWWGEVLILVHP